MTETAEKIRLKFRVSSMTEPKWSEKWGVSLAPNEEFHVTDRLLKLPFQESAPQTVCTFCVVGGLLLFKQVDLDRLSTLNGKVEKECSPKVGDQIRIGETILVEVVLAPARLITKTATLAPIPDIRDIDRCSDRDGPTLTVPTNGTIIRDASLEILEPSLKYVSSDLSPARKFSLPPEPKIELASSPHLHHDDFQDRLAAMAETGPEGVEPLYAKKAALSSKRMSISERILGVVARVLRRDELNPPSEKFPLDKENTNSGMIQLQEPKFKQPLRSEYSPSPLLGRVPPKAWTPEAIPSGPRMRGRAIIFIASAAGALMLAVAVLKISKQFSGDSGSDDPSKNSELTKYKRGLPVEVLEEKVRRMRR